MEGDKSLKDELDQALENARKRGQEWLKEFQTKSPTDQIETLASIIYVCVLLDPYGYPNGLPTWDELPDVDFDYKLGYDKQRYIQAVNRVIDLLPYLSEELK